MRLLVAWLNVLLIAQLNWAQTAPTRTGDPAQLSGYTAQFSKAEREGEKKFRDGIARDNLRESMRRLSARPHHVGSPDDKENADWILSEFKQWGFDAHIETFQVLFPTPKERVVELVQPTPVLPGVSCKQVEPAGVAVRQRCFETVEAGGRFVAEVVQEADVGMAGFPADTQSDGGRTTCRQRPARLLRTNCSPFADDTSTSRKTAFAKVKNRVLGTATPSKILGV